MFNKELYQALAFMLSNDGTPELTGLRGCNEYWEDYGVLLESKASGSLVESEFNACDVDYWSFTLGMSVDKFAEVYIKTRNDLDGSFWEYTLATELATFVSAQGSIHLRIGDDGIYYFY